ncbi:MAG: peptidylprolyl isomerase [Steroidobacteraceae bacterium]
MNISKDRVALIHYTLKDDAGAVIDSSAGGEPLAYLHGNGNLVPGLETALEGRQAGEKFSVTVPPAEGYGTRDDRLVQQVPKRQLSGAGEVRKGMQFQAQVGGAVRVFTVTAIIGDMITLDGNHQLADQNLNFDIDVVSVRDASQEELQHGHVHGPGGHHHH